MNLLKNVSFTTRYASMSKFLDFLPAGMTMAEFYNLSPLEKMRLMRKHDDRKPSGTVGYVLNDSEIAVIDQETQTAYSRARYGEAAWLVAMKDLATLGFSVEEIVWVLNSKNARWAADAFHGQTDLVLDEDGDVDDCTETLNGTELTQYHLKWGIELKDMDAA